jgi:hypothetical protein
MLSPITQSVLLTLVVPLILAGPIVIPALHLSDHRSDLGREALLPVHYHDSSAKSPSSHGRVANPPRSSTINTNVTSNQRREDPRVNPKPQRSTGENGLIGAIYMCTERGYQGFCSYAQYDMEVCYNLFPPYANNISSFGPDQYAGDETFRFKCSLFSEEACKGRELSMVWPGTPNVGYEDSVIENVEKSIRCQFQRPDAMETYKAWKEQGYDFNKERDRGGKCPGTDRYCP